MGKFNSKEMEFIKQEYFTPGSKFSAIRNNILTQLRAQKSKFKQIMTEVESGKNVIADIQVAGKRIYVFTVSDDITVKNRWPVEIYDLKGKLVKKSCFKELPAEIWQDFVFFTDRDEEDNPRILKYKIIED